MVAGRETARAAPSPRRRRRGTAALAERWNAATRRDQPGQTARRAWRGQETSSGVGLPLGVLSPDGTTLYAPAPPASASGLRNSRIIAYDTVARTQLVVAEIARRPIGYGMR